MAMGYYSWVEAGLTTADGMSEWARDRSQISGHTLHTVRWN